MKTWIRQKWDALTADLFGPRSPAPAAAAEPAAPPAEQPAAHRHLRQVLVLELHFLAHRLPAWIEAAQVLGVPPADLAVLRAMALALTRLEELVHPDDAGATPPAAAPGV